MIALLLSLLSDPCPPKLSPAECAVYLAASARQDECVARAYKPRDAGLGVPDSDARLVSRLEAEHACAISGWGYAITSSAAVRRYRAAVDVCPPCPACAPEECSTFTVAAIAGATSCALCVGAASAICRAVP